MKETKTKTIRGIASFAAILLGLTALRSMASASPSLNELIGANQLISHQMEGALISRNQKETVNVGALRLTPKNVQQPYLEKTFSKRTDIKLAEKPLPQPEKEKPILLADSTWSKFKDAVKEGGRTAVQPGAVSNTAKGAAERTTQGASDAAKNSKWEATERKIKGGVKVGPGHIEVEQTYKKKK